MKRTFISFGNKSRISKSKNGKLKNRVGNDNIYRHYSSIVIVSKLKVLKHSEMTTSVALAGCLNTAAAVWADGLVEHISKVLELDSKGKAKVKAAFESYCGTPITVKAAKVVSQNLAEKKTLTLVLNYSDKSHALFGAPTKETLLEKLNDANKKNTAGKDGKAKKIFSFNKGLAFGPGWVFAQEHLDAMRKLIKSSKVEVEEIELAALEAKAKETKGKDAKAKSKAPAAAAASDSSDESSASAKDGDDDSDSEDDSSSDDESSKASTKSNKSAAKGSGKGAKTDDASTKLAASTSAKGGKGAKGKDAKTDDASKAKAAKADPKAKDSAKGGAKPKDAKGAKEIKIVKNKWDNEVYETTNLVVRSLPVGAAGRKIQVVIGAQDPKASDKSKGLASVHPLTDEQKDECVKNPNKFEVLTDEKMTSLKKTDPKTHAELLKWISTASKPTKATKGGAKAAAADDSDATSDDSDDSGSNDDSSSDASSD